MKIYPSQSKTSGLTVLEILVVIFTLTVLVALLLPVMGPGHISNGVTCISNQRQVTLGFILFTTDNDGKYPWQLDETNADYLKGCTNGYAAADYNASLDYIKWLPLFVCPSDPDREPAPDHSRLLNKNISYFVGYDAGTNASANILIGDRHLVANGNPVAPGLFTYTTNQAMSWSSELHRWAAPRGVMSFYDGHTELVPGANINAAFQREGLVQARFAVP